MLLASLILSSNAPFGGGTFPFTLALACFVLMLCLIRALVVFTWDMLSTFQIVWRYAPFFILSFSVAPALFSFLIFVRYFVVNNLLE